MRIESNKPLHFQFFVAPSPTVEKEDTLSGGKIAAIVVGGVLGFLVISYACSVFKDKCIVVTNGGDGGYKADARYTAASSWNHHGGDSCHIDTGCDTGCDTGFGGGCDCN